MTVNNASIANSYVREGSIGLFLEFVVDPSGFTIDLTLVDGGEGIGSVRSVFAFDSTGAQVTGKVTVSANGTLLTFAAGSSAIVTVLVLGR